MPARVGVVLSSYERADGLQRAIDSLRQQSFTDWRCVICDDHSGDSKVHEVIAGAENNDARFIVLRKHRHFSDAQKRKVCSFSHHINTALDWFQRLGITYVCYLLDDVVYHEHRIAQHVRYLDDHPRVFLVWGEQWLIEYRANGTVKRERKQIPHKRDNYPGISMWVIIDRLSRANIINHCSATHRLSDDRWSTKAAHWRFIDWKLWQQFAMDGKLFVHIPVVGETMHSSPNDIGPMFAKGKDIAEVARRRRRLAGQR